LSFGIVYGWKFLVLRARISTY